MVVNFQWLSDKLGWRIFYFTKNKDSKSIIKLVFLKFLFPVIIQEVTYDRPRS